MNINMNYVSFSRRNVRVRSSDSPLVLTKTARKSTSPNSSQRSSISDISVSAVNKQKLINGKFTYHVFSSALLFALSAIYREQSQEIVNFKLSIILMQFRTFYLRFTRMFSHTYGAHQPRASGRTGPE